MAKSMVSNNVWKKNWEQNVKAGGVFLKEKLELNNKKKKKFSKKKKMRKIFFCDFSLLHPLQKLQSPKSKVL